MYTNIDLLIDTSTVTIIIAHPFYNNKIKQNKKIHDCKHKIGFRINFVQRR